MLQYPNIDPVIFKFTDTLQVRWYGVMYLLGFAGAWLACRLRTKHLSGWQSTDKLNDLVFYTALGVILGGRIGYTLFYGLPGFLDDPLKLLRIWEGGMSFHGGLIGVMISTWVFSRHNKYSFLYVGDLIAPTVPIAIATVRFGNFINGEIWGKVTQVPWGMVFPHAGPFPRHPSQLYAVILEGFLLFLVVWIYSSKPRPVGKVTGVFVAGYALIRIFEEFFRQPDPQYGYLAFGWLTMGQVLCVPMLVFGLWLLFRDKKVLKCKPI